MPQPRKVQDRFFKQAKADGFVARSAYKLDEIQRRKKIIAKGDFVLDLGCAPGSWVQVAASLVGDRGFVLGLDLKPVTIPNLPNARTLVQDVFTATAPALLEQSGLTDAAHSRGKNRFDVVLSDMAPNTEGGGGRIGDHFKSIELCRRVLELLPAVLRPGGHLAMKVFEGEAYPDLLKETGAIFREAKGFKPESSRDVSREMFIVALGYEPALKSAPSGPPPGIAKAPPAPRPGWGQPGPGSGGGGKGAGGRGGR